MAYSFCYLPYAICYTLHFVIFCRVCEGCAPLLSQYLYFSKSIFFRPFGPFSYEPSMSINPPSLLLRFSCTTTRNFRSPLLPVRLNLITKDIMCIFPLFVDL